MPVLARGVLNSGMLLRILKRDFRTCRVEGASAGTAGVHMSRMAYISRVRDGSVVGAIASSEGLEGRDMVEGRREVKDGGASGAAS